jgi:hypothetical protein
VDVSKPDRKPPSRVRLPLRHQPVLGTPDYTERRKTAAPEDRLLYFSGRDCGPGWLPFRADAHSRGWREEIDSPGQPSCSVPFDFSLTRYRLEAIAYRFRELNSELTTYTIQTIVSEHFDNSTIDAATMMERFYFGQFWGKLRWERWGAPDTPQPYESRGLPERRPSLALSGPPAPVDASYR